MPREIDDLAAVAQHAPCALDYTLTHLRERHVLRLALDERGTQVILEFLELGGEGGLTHKALRRRLAEMTRVGERDEVLEIFELEFSHGWP